MKKTLTNVTVNWKEDFGVYAINRDSRLYEDVSDHTDGLTIEIHKDVDPDDVADIIAERYHDVPWFDIDYTLYTEDRKLVGFAYRLD